MEEMIQEGKDWVAGGKEQGDAKTTKCMDRLRTGPDQGW